MTKVSVAIVILVFVALVVLAVWLTSRQKNRGVVKDKPNSDFRERRAKALGWQYDGTYRGDIRYRFFGSTDDNHQWELRYDCNASSSASVPMVYWEMSGLKADRTEFEISNGRSFGAMQNPTGKGLAAGVGTLARLVGANDGSYLDFAREATVQPVGSGRLRLHLKVIARSPADVAGLLDDETQNLLLNWPRAAEGMFDPFRDVKITRDTQSLRIEFKYDTSDMPLFEHVVKLGCTLAQRISSHHI